MNKARRQVTLLCSGTLGLEALRLLNKLDYLKSVFTDRKSDEIMKYCERKKIPIFVGNPRNSDYNYFLQENAGLFLLSVNYLFLLDDKFLSKFNIKLNIHGSLLPKYRGRTPHVWAIINNEVECGVTIHEIVLNCDAGNILMQQKIKISQHDTGGTLLHKYSVVYKKLIKKTVALLDNGKLEFIPQNEEEATFYGKRTEVDGLINWEWQKDRIRNWVRAQTMPYPGAYSFINGNKIRIYEVKYSQFGFSWEDINGLIVKIENRSLFVKSSNGVLEICKWQSEESSFLPKKGDCFHA